MMNFWRKMKYARQDARVMTEAWRAGMKFMTMPTVRRDTR